MCQRLPFPHPRFLIDMSTLVPSALPREHYCKTPKSTFSQNLKLHACDPVGAGWPSLACSSSGGVMGYEIRTGKA